MTSYRGMWQKNWLVPAEGFEPSTFDLKDRCSNQAELRRHMTILVPQTPSQQNDRNHGALGC